MPRTLARPSSADGLDMAAFCAFIVCCAGAPLPFRSIGATLGSSAGLMVITALQLLIPRSAACTGLARQRSGAGPLGRGDLGRNAKSKYCNKSALLFLLFYREEVVGLISVVVE